MNTTDQPNAADRGSGCNDGLGLVPCPLCGACAGYALSEGSTYRWWRMQCSACGGDLGECASDRRMSFGESLPARWKHADAAWNDAGKHAQDLRAEIARLRAELAEAVTALPQAVRTAVDAERERFAMTSEQVAALTIMLDHFRGDPRTECLRTLVYAPNVLVSRQGGADE